MAAKTVLVENQEAEVCCPMCTHTVKASVHEVQAGWHKKWLAVAGQRCSRCWTSLDAAFIVRILEPETHKQAPKKERKNVLDELTTAA